MQLRRGEPAADNASIDDTLAGETMGPGGVAATNGGLGVFDFTGHATPWTVEDSDISGNVTEAFSPTDGASGLLGGLTLTNTQIARNVPDQCYGC
ncbi:MAG: hypothetical protein WAL04_01030 [Acidimicrobiales bacterium]|jgi:hypothetical protein